MGEIHGVKDMAVKKKVLIVNDMVQGGGVEKLMYDLVWHWHKKFDISVMTYGYYREGETLFPEDVRYLSASVKKEHNSNIFVKQLDKVRRKFYEKFFEQKLDRMGFDMVIAIKDGWVTQKVSRMKIPVKYGWNHTDYNRYYYTQGIFGTAEKEYECMKGFQKIVCVAESVRQGVIDVIGDPGNLVVKYNPINVEDILEQAREPVVDIEEMPSQGVPRFVTVGRLNHQKGYDLLLEACYMLERDGLQFEVLIIGGEEPWGDEHNRLYRTQKRLGLKNVRFLGGRKNPYKYMRCADWFLSSSIFEGFSLVSQEAAVLDIPLILTDCSGVRELLGDGEYGIVMGISVLEIYKNMKRVIMHPELHEHYKEKIMERKQMICFDERIKEIEELFL